MPALTLACVCVTLCASKSVAITRFRSPLRYQSQRQTATEPPISHCLRQRDVLYASFNQRPCFVISSLIPSSQPEFVLCTLQVNRRHITHRDTRNRSRQLSAIIFDSRMNIYRSASVPQMRQRVARMRKVSFPLYPQTTQ